MATVLRVKRRLEDNPQDALVLLCKRMKTDTEEISPSLFVFRATVDDQETTHVKNIVPSREKLQTKTNVNDIIEKIRKEKKEACKQNRYEIVNCSRRLRDEKAEADDFDLVDLQVSDDKDGAQFAYDLYVSAKEDFDISMLDNLISIENYETDLIFGSYRDNGEPESEEDNDDDDSNDENNWRNDYPDSEPSSIDEEEIIRAMERVDIEDDLSSDTGEDKIYDDPTDMFSEDVQRYGPAYAKYKAKVFAENPDLSDTKGLVHCAKMKDLDEESIDGYKDDSDDGFYYGQEHDTEQFREQYGNDSSDEYSPD